MACDIPKVLKVACRQVDMFVRFGTARSGLEHDPWVSRSEFDSCGPRHFVLLYYRLSFESAPDVGFDKIGFAQSTDNRSAFFPATESVTLRGSFSAVWTPIFASKSSYESSWRDLQDFFSPLRLPNFQQDFVLKIEISWIYLFFRLLIIAIFFMLLLNIG